ncbi:hypothetical protein QUF72_00290 [Desulfobacterales bacterium HSG2]|nr:hypothetical protein [Desulfobacterales bacterium HSG2]
MRQLTKIMFVLLGSLILLFASSDAKEPVHIGLSAPITGKYAGYGDSFKKAIGV